MKKQTPSIWQLRREGWKVRVLHQRPTINGEPAPKGGSTKIELTNPQGQTATGLSVCSKDDPWNRKTGNQIALGRALINITENMIDSQQTIN
jgi:hypothetical protein